MPHRSTHTNYRKIYNFLLKLKSPLAAITQRVFAAPADAHRHGWQITITRGGFGRTYRDPRFDYLAECTTCNGRGCLPGDTTCSPCHGTGRIVLDPAAFSLQGRGQP
jgi:DnaJ-class molecular chaperone